jgi:hypothetical protein
MAESPHRQRSSQLGVRVSDKFLRLLESQCKHYDCSKAEYIEGILALESLISRGNVATIYLSDLPKWLVKHYSRGLLNALRQKRREFDKEDSRREEIILDE